MRTQTLEQKFGQGNRKMGVRGGLGKLVWWGKEGTDIGKGGNGLIRNTAQIFGFPLTSA